MNDTELQQLFQQSDVPVESAPGQKEAMLTQILSRSNGMERGFSVLERFLFTRPIQAAGIAAVTITGALWGVLGSRFPALISALIG